MNITGLGKHAGKEISSKSACSLIKSIRILV